MAFTGAFDISIEMLLTILCGVTAMYIALGWIRGTDLFFEIFYNLSKTRIEHDLLVEQHEQLDRSFQEQLHELKLKERV